MDDRPAIRLRRDGKPANRSGRPRTKDYGQMHLRREPLLPTEAAHVRMVAERDLGSLRTPAAYEAIRRALLRVIDRDSCAFAHVSIQADHIHLLAEADDQIALARGMQAFQISCARHMNILVSASRPKQRRGRVFTDRYAVEILRTPEQVRIALAYVLDNWRRHGEAPRGPALDPFSTAPTFDGWRTPDVRTAPWPFDEPYRPLVTREARTHLLRDQWRRLGLLDPGELPAP